MPTKTHHLENSNSKRMLCVWLPEWPIQRLVVARPKLRRQRVILFWQHPQRGQLVAVASPRAQLDGVCREMPLSEAKSLALAAADTSPVIEVHQAEVDRVHLIQLALACECFSPLIGIEQAAQPSSIFLDISGLGHLFGSEASLIEQVKSHFESGGYHPILGVANTMGMASALARFPDCSLQTLPVETLRVSKVMLDTLHQLGIEHVGQLQSLPRAAIKTRLGEQVGRRLDELTGEREEVLNTLHRSAELTANKFLDFAISNTETIEIVIERLIAQLCRQLQPNQRGAIQWLVELAGPERSPLRVNVNLFQPTATVSHVMQILKMQMEGLSMSHQGISRGRAVQDVTVSVLRSVLLTERQRELFDENPRLNRQAFAQLVNRLASNLGSQNVLQPRLLSGAQAEFATRMVPLVGPGADFEDTADVAKQTSQLAKKLARKTKRKSTAGKPGAVQLKQYFPLDRPLRLYERPVELQAVSISDGRPALLIGKQQQLRVRRTWGPERVESGWWRGPAVRRDYWRVETNNGRWLWVYRDLKSRGWFLHGEF